METDMKPDSDGFRSLRVLETRKETLDAVSVFFETPSAIQWQPGQHVTLRFDLNGTEVRRSYSISNSPFDSEPMRITVKRVDGGLVSNHINDCLAAGDAVDVMPPFGGFRLVPEPHARRTYYFFGAGSGITPLYAMIRSVLVAEPHSVIRLAYGNSNENAVIFREDLTREEKQSGGRLTVRHFLTRPARLSSFSGRGRGRIDAAAVSEFIDEHPPYAQDTQYYICGPGEMNAGVRAALMSLDVPDERIYTESYGAVVPPDLTVEGIAARVTVRLNGETLQVSVNAGQTVLNAVRALGAKPPYSCESGVCGACRARLRTGDVHLRARMALSDADLAQGNILTCQALPTSPGLIVDYD